MVRLEFEFRYLATRPASPCPCRLSLAVPGGIAAESLTFTPLEDMIFLKWEEPQEPNGLITQYEVGLDPIIVRAPGGRRAHSLEREVQGGGTEVIIEVPSAVIRVWGLQGQGTGRQEREVKVPRGLGGGACTVPLSLSLGPALSRAHLHHDGCEALGPVTAFPIPVSAHLPILPPDQLPEHRVVRPSGERARPTTYHLQAPQ